MKEIIYTLCVTVLLWVSYLTGEESTKFEFTAITGIHYESFKAAHADCVAKHKEQCKLGAGFVPKSYFK